MIIRDKAIIEIYRGAGYIGRLLYKSLTLSYALNEVREPELVIPIVEADKVRIGDTIRVRTEAGQEDYIVHIITTDYSESDPGAILSLEPCGSVLRCAAISGDTLFDESTVVGVFNKISQHMVEEIGTTIPVVLSNVGNFNFGARYSTSGNNILESLRNVCGATGNSFRILNNPCRLEIGQFGEDSGAFFTGPGKDHSALGLKWLSIKHTSDWTDIVNAIYVEGGSYSLGDNQMTLLMGDGTVTPARYSTVPPDYALDLVTRNGKKYFRLRKISALGCSRRINIGGVSPVVAKGSDDPTKPEITKAEQLLTDIAVKYLSIKSQPSIMIDIIAPWVITDLKIGATARVVLRDLKAAPVLVDLPYYITALEFRWSDDSIQTAVTLSNRLYDPDELLSVSNQSTDKKGNPVPVQGVGVIEQAIPVTVTNLNPTCDLVGRLATIDYSAAKYTATPTITPSFGVGNNATIVSANKTTATICVTGPIPAVGTVKVSGVA